MRSECYLLISVCLYLQRSDCTRAEILDDIVIVCLRGGGAKNTYEHLKAKGIPESRLFILEKGVEGWPYQEMFIHGK